MRRLTLELPRQPARLFSLTPHVKHQIAGLTNYLYLVPIFAFVGGITYYAIGYTAYVSTLNWNGIDLVAQSVGLANYQAILHDPIFFQALSHTLIFMVLTIFIQMALGLGIATLLRTRVHLKGIYKVIFFIPVVLAPSVISYVFRHLFDANTGEVNHFFDSLGLHGLSLTWLADPHLALYVLVLINIWEWTGFSFILYFAGLTAIDPALYEAARMDGANAWQVFRHLTIPLLRSTHVSLIILGVIGSLKTFDIVFLTTGGGPGRATEFLTTYIYKTSLLDFNDGYAAALSMVLFAFAFIVTLIQLRAFRTA